MKRLTIILFGILLAASSVFAATETFSDGFGDWFNEAGDGMAFTRINTATPSTGTGPDYGVDGVSDYYIYVEADVNCGDNFTVEYPAVDFSDGVNVTWYYHMDTDFAIRMGWVYLEVENTTGVWDVVWTRSKVDLGNVWHFNYTYITEYTGNHALRFRYLTVPEIQCYNADVGLDNISISASSGSSPVTESINITFTSLNSLQKWQSQKGNNLYLSGTTNYSSRVVLEYDNANQTVCSLCSSFNISLPLLNITKVNQFKIYANSSLRNASKAHNVSFYRIDTELFEDEAPKLYFGTADYDAKKTQWKAADANDGPTFAHAYDKAKHKIKAETFGVGTYAYNDFVNLNMNPENKANDCSAAAIMCAFDGNVSSGQNTVYGSPTNYCTLMEKCMEDTNRWDNGAYNYGFMDTLGRAYVNYALARDVGGQNMSVPLKLKVKEDFFNMSLQTLYRLRLDISAGGVVNAGTANYDTTSRVMVGLGVVHLMLSLDSDENVTGDFPYCDRIMTLTGTCDTTFGVNNRIANETLFPGADTITRQMVIDAVIEELCGRPTSNDDLLAGPEWISAYCFNFLYAQSGLTYPNWVHQVQDPLLYVVLRGSGVDLLEMQSDIYDGGLELTDGERYSVPFEVSGHDLYASSQQWSIWRAYSLNLSRNNDDLMNHHMTIAEGLFIPYQYNGNAYVVQNGQAAGYFVWAEEGIIALEDSVDDTNESNRCAGETTNTTVLNSFGFGMIYKDKCDRNDFALYLRAKQKVVDLGRQRTAQGGFYLLYEGVYLVSPAGTPDRTNMNDDNSAPFASGEGFNVTDPCLWNGELDMEEWMHASNMQNVLLVDGYGAQSTQCINGTFWYNIMKDPFTIIDSLDNNEVSAMVMNGTYTNDGVKSVDEEGVILKRTFIYDKHQVYVIDSVSKTNGSIHNYSRQFQLGEGVSQSGVQDIDRANNNASHCEQSLCVDFYFGDDVDLYTYTSGDATHYSGGWGYHEILVATSENNDDMLTVLYPRADSDNTINYTENSDLNFIISFIDNTTHRTYFNYTKSSDVWKITRWLKTDQSFIDKTYDDGTDIAYTTSQGTEVYPIIGSTPNDNNNLPTRDGDLVLLRVLMFMALLAGAASLFLGDNPIAQYITLLIALVLGLALLGAVIP